MELEPFSELAELLGNAETVWRRHGADWERLAACRGVPAGLFHPARGDVRVSEDRRLGRLEKRRLKVWKAWCSRCPVRADCLARGFADDSITETADTGASVIMGGTLTEERRRYKAELSAVAA